MRTIRTKVYKFAELSKEAQQTAIESLYDINVSDSFWYESIYEDAKVIGLNITGFDIDRASYCNGDFDYSGIDTALKIVAEHGETSETYKDAQTFINDYNALLTKFPIAEDEDGFDTNEYDRESEIEELEEDFFKTIKEDYRSILLAEFEYQTSREQIIESIKANEYDFLKDGSQYR